MKSTVYRMILTALAASLSLASCTKEMEADPGNGGTPAAEGVREFTLSFAAPVKSAPGTDWYHPVFSEGDVIRVSNNTTFEDCVVTGSGSAAKIKTTLTGTLTAVYPSTAAVLSSGTTGHITGITVPAAQDGTFAAANICMAENIAVGATSITLENKTALFKVTPPSDVTEFTVTSLKAVEGGVARTGTAVPINSSEVVLENKVITVSNTTLTDFYVSLLPGAKLSDLSFEYTVTGETYDGAMKGIPEKDIEAQATALSKTKDAFNNLTAGNAYDIGSGGWHPYVTIGGLKWATMNIGATDTDPYGTYFEWGNTTGHALKAENLGKTGTISSAFESDYNFSWANCPYQTVNTSDYSSTKFTKYLGSTSSSYKDASATDANANKTVLDLTDDAAYANWGGPWRMPTGGTESNADFTALGKAANASYASGALSYNGTINTSGAPSSQGVYYYKVSGEIVGVYFVDSSLKKLFFPAGGYGSGTSIYSAGDGGYCWSCYLHTDNPTNAFRLGFLSGNVGLQYSYGRYYGLPVRPVADREISEESANPAEMEEENVF